MDGAAPGDLVVTVWLEKIVVGGLQGVSNPSKEGRSGPLDRLARNSTAGVSELDEANVGGTKVMMKPSELIHALVNIDC